MTIGQRQVELTPKSLICLNSWHEPGAVFAKKIPLERAGTIYEGYDRTIDFTHQSLRAKIEDNPEIPKWCLPLWGFGYNSATTLITVADFRRLLIRSFDEQPFSFKTVTPTTVPRFNGTSASRTSGNTLMCKPDFFKIVATLARVS